MPREALKMGTFVRYVCGEILTRADTGEIHAGHTMGGSRAPGKILPALVTKDATPPEDEGAPYVVDLAIFKNDPNDDLPDFGANVVVMHEVPYGEDGTYNTWHGSDETPDVSAARAAQ